MGKAKPITAAGRRRVQRALDRHGLLLTQGQWEIPSVADLLEGASIATRGYSWDYVPAWEHCEQLAEQPGVARAKLFRGRTTLIARRLWPAVDTLARGARARIQALPTRDEQRTFLAQVETSPGMGGGELREQLALDARAFQRIKGRLEQKLCTFGVEREELDYHTHESCWFPWSASKLAKGLDRRRRPPDPETAARILLESVYPNGLPAKRPRITTLFPLLH